MADKEGPVLHQNQDQGPNQAPNQNPPPEEDPQNAPPPPNPFMSNAPLAPVVPQRPQLNWSHFKPEYAGKPDEDTEAHLLRTDDWIDTHKFLDQVKVQRFCLTLVWEARLWYESLRTINANWDGLQNMFRQQYSMIGNTREQLFHAWRSFHFDKNTEKTDAYVNCIRQVATLLGYQEPQILEGFKNTLPTKLYWVLFPIMDFRQVVEQWKEYWPKKR